MSRRVPRVYVAGPYTARPHWSHRIPLLGRWLKRRAVVRNIRNAVDVGVMVAEAELYPVIPHANTADARFEEAQGYEFWIETTLDALRTCDAIVMVDGWTRSNGAVGEFDLSQELGIPCLDVHYGQVCSWSCGLVPTPEEARRKWRAKHEARLLWFGYLGDWFNLVFLPLWLIAALLHANAGRYAFCFLAIAIATLAATSVADIWQRSIARG